MMPEPRPLTRPPLSPADRRRLLELLHDRASRVAAERGIPRRQGGGPAPLSFAQQRLWFVDALKHAGPAYNIAFAVELAGGLVVPALAAALAGVVHRHEVLRSVFELRGGEPVQVALPAAPVALPLVDLARLPRAAAAAETRRLERAEARRPFDLRQGRPLRAVLWRQGPREHRLSLTLHHIVSDGWSTSILTRELAALYAAGAARRAGAPPPLAALPIQYADYAVWQRQQLTGTALAAAELAWWRGQLGDAPPLTALPADRARTATSRHGGRLLSFRLGPPAVAAARQLAGQGGATLFMALLAVYQVLVARLSGQRDLVVGSPIANRGRPETEPLVGCFANLLALRLRLPGNPGMREVLSRVSAATLGAFEHQELPFERLIDELGLARTLSHNPLVQVVFVLQNAPAAAALAGPPPAAPPGPAAPAAPAPPAAVAVAGDLQLVPARVATGTAKFDLALTLAEHGEALAGGLEYSTDLFDAATVERWLGYYERLLAAAAARPDAGVDELPLLSAPEWAQLVHEWGGDRARFAAAALDRLFEAQAARSPEAVALAGDGHALSYAELDRRANRLARVLRGLGAAPEVPVALALERSPLLVVAILAVLKTGAAYVPFDPEHPGERLRFVLADTGAPVLVTSRELAPRWEPLPPGVRQVWVEEATAGAARAGAARDLANLGLDLDPQSLAYVIYTSGSTGVPKGVAVCHAHVSRLLAATDAGFGCGPRDVWTLFHSYAFDFSVWEMWGALLHGGRLVLVPRAVSRDPAAFHRLLAEESVTVLNQTPSAFAQLQRADAAAMPLRALRSVIFGGEALDVERLGPWWARYGDRHPRLVNMYGITETTVHVTYRPLDHRDLAAAGAGSPLGGPIPDLELYLLDAYLRPAPIGVAGEIAVGGAGVARGYLGRPELTAARFVPNPFAELPGQRLYRSGDLARRRPDGGLEYLGRIDHQVKIRGFRIELGEIESALSGLPAVAAAAVVAHGSGADRRLVAYVVPAGEAPLDLPSVRRSLERALPSYMVPSALVPLAELPRNANGKLDAERLPAPGAGREHVGSTYLPPRTPYEEILCAVLSEVLGVAEVGIEDNLFALGADSIRSLRILARAQERGLALALPDLFRHQTVAALAAVSALHGATPEEVPVTRPFDLVDESERRRLPPDVEDAYPLAELQQGMLYHMVLTPDEPAYHNVDSWHLGGRLDPVLFQEAVRRVVRRHPFLRTSFDLESGDRPLQRVHRRAELPVHFIDLARLAPARQETEIDLLLACEKRRHFDLARPPQLRLYVSRRSPHSFQFTLTENHAICDGWSLHATLAEIFELHYALLAGGSPPEPPPLRLAFRDYVHRERLALASPAAAAFWTGVVRGASRLEIAAWPPRRAAASPRPRKHWMQVAPATLAGLRDLAREAAVPLKSVLLAAHMHVLGFLGGRVDVLSGLVANGRLEEPEGDQVRGLFLNTLPFRLQLDAADWRQLVLDTLAAETAMLPHRRYPFAALQRSLGQGPLFDVAFNFVHFHVVQPLLGPRGKVEVLGGRGAEGASFRLLVHFVLSPDGTRLDLRLEHDAGTWSPAGAERLAARYRRCLEAMAAAPHGRCLDHAWLLDEERHQLLHEWNPAAPASDAAAPERSLAELLALQAARTPDAVALVWRDRSLTYGELDRHAARVARRLRRLGVGPETIVGLHMQRSPELLIGMLGILEAGGAYLPLDPAYPQARLASMLADAGAAILVTGERQAGAFHPAMAAARVVGVWEPGAAAGGEPALAASEGPPPSPENLAYVLYTSGSTGRPKGVALTHGGAAAFARWVAEACSPAELAGVLAATSACFDLSIFELLAPLVSGGTVLLAESVLELPELAMRDGVRTLNTVPSAIAELAASGELPAGPRLVNLAGEPLRRELVERLHELLPRARVVNLYGPTEDTTYSTASAQRRGESRPPALGRPLPGKRLYLLDPLLRPVPPGGTGEICLGGHGLARGYLGRPELTAARFVPDPLGATPGARLYRTGDLGRYRPDGEVEFLGRLDHQVKLRGFRIEPGEIEALLAGHPRVRESVVVARRDGVAGLSLAAYLTAAGEPPAREELRAWLRTYLPQHMVPATFTFLATLPLLPNGKLDRGALPEPEQAAERPVAEPRGSLEVELAAIWRELLGPVRIGRDDNFFDLGGHSLLLIQLRRRIREQLHGELSMLEMFRYTTLAALAERLAGSAEAPPPTIRDAQREAGKERLRHRLASRGATGQEETQP
jgi:amino acid adenylation domain-containing protein